MSNLIHKYPLGYLAVLSLVLVFLSSCKNDQPEKDHEIILQYISDHGLTAIEGDEGLFYTMDSVGTGYMPVISSNVTVDYEGFLTDGTKFDSSLDYGSPISFDLTDVIRGWQLGIPKYHEGGSGKLLIPSALAYGKNPPPGSVIPKNAVLIFDIWLISVQ